MLETLQPWQFCHLRQPGEYLPRLTPGNFYEPTAPEVAKLAADSWAKRYAHLINPQRRSSDTAK